MGSRRTKGGDSFLKRVRSAREDAASEAILCDVLKPLKAAQNSCGAPGMTLMASALKLRACRRAPVGDMC